MYMIFEGARELKKEGEQERPCLVQQSLEVGKRGSIGHFHREFIPRNGEPHQGGCFPPEPKKTVVVQIKVMSSQFTFS